jgi:phospholipid/cholesterol/gamma-HCH transport system substrate-binding protein
MAKQASRKMIGGFVIIAVAVLVASVVIFGSGDLFKKKDVYVLYFDGSVKGLKVGSAVLYRGVEVGKVTKILIRSDVEKLQSFIPVFIEVYPDSFELIGGGENIGTPKERLKKLIDMGLRAQLVSESMITGQLQIEVMMHPGAPLTLHNLDRGYTEFPTIPSTLQRLGSALEEVDLKQFEARLSSILTSADRILKNPDIEASLHNLRGVLEDARGLVANVNGKVDPLAENLNRTITDARGLVDNVGQQVKPLAGKATSTLDDISKLVRDVDARVDPLSKQLSDTLKSVESAFKSIDGLVGKDTPTRAELDSTLQELSGAARSLRILADYLEQHPESLIKGKGY